MFNIDTAAEKLSAFGKTIKKAPMKDFTTFKTGGFADILVAPRSYADCAEIVKYCHQESIPMTVIGAGSNLLVSDRGLRGVVIRIASDIIQNPKIEVEGDGVVYSDAAIMKEDFIKFAIQNSLGGVEFMAGIPGAVGGGIVMNAGTFMGTFIDILEEIIYIDKTGELKTVTAEREMAHYRGIDVEDLFIVCAGRFRLPSADGPELSQKVEAILADRKQKHPLQFPSAGSVFKNPDGNFAWKLVNDSGLKGCRIGGAMVSEQHTNFIINYEAATSQNIRELVRHVQKTVHDKFSVDLHTEIRMLGDF